MLNRLRDDVRRRPLRYYALGCIAGDGLLSLGGMRQGEGFVALAPLAAMATDAVLIAFGHGGDSAKRTVTQNWRLATLERGAMAGFALGGTLFLLGGRTFIGACVIAGAAAGAMPERAGQNGSRRAALVALRRGNFKESARQVTRMPPLKKASLIWPCANLGLAQMVWQTQNPFYAAALGMFALGYAVLGNARQAGVSTGAGKGIGAAVTPNP